MKKYITEYLIAAHKGTIFNYKEIMERELCGCFNCLRTFYLNEIFY